MMERLTERHYKVSDGAYLKCSEECASLCCDDCDKLDRIVDRLAAYEDLEEEGRLVVLPCKVGDAVWRIKKGICPEKGTCVSGDVCSEMIMGICPDYSGKPTVERSTFRLCDYNDVGKTVFRTREEAEAKLKEREGK